LTQTLLVCTLQSKISEPRPARLFVLLTAALVAAFCFEKREDRMGILESAKPAIVICTRDRGRAMKFYGETLGLVLAYEDKFAAVFNCGAITLRVSLVADFAPHEHTILGFHVADVKATVRALCDKGVTFKSYPGFPQDELGILTLPEGAGQVAWFQDPDGNVLSVTNV
jgi:predicted enzyme related to lactoylglutathione lyase